MQNVNNDIRLAKINLDNRMMEVSKYYTVSTFDSYFSTFDVQGNYLYLAGILNSNAVSVN